MKRWGRSKGRHGPERETYGLLVYGKDGGVALYGPCDLGKAVEVSEMETSPLRRETHKVYDVRVLPMLSPDSILLAPQGAC